MKDNRNILVTGGAGFIGSHTVVELINKGFNPVIVDDFRNADPNIINGIEKIVDQAVVFHQIDV